MNATEKLLYPDELADALRRGRCYVFAMKKAGFTMPGGTATLSEARNWLRRNPHFKTTDYFKKSTGGVVATLNTKCDNGVRNERS